MPGIRALVELAGRRLDQLTAADLGFIVAPRLNAAGRLTDMSVGIACLLADDLEQARHLPRSSRSSTRSAAKSRSACRQEAVGLAASVRFDSAGDEALGLCLFDESWHQGVVGLVAGRIKDRLHRPSSPLREPRTERCAAPRARSPRSISAMPSTESPPAIPD